MASDVFWSQSSVRREDRVKLLGRTNKVVWLTGLSGSGKSTIAKAVEKRLHDLGVLSYTLDGDNVRHGLNADLGFSAEDRRENLRRIREVAKLFHDAGVFTLVSFICPYDEERRLARRLIGSDFVEIFVSCPLEVCEQRDPKGLYKRARAGELKEFTGISAPYETPTEAEIVLDTSKLTVEQCVAAILEQALDQ